MRLLFKLGINCIILKNFGYYPKFSDSLCLNDEEIRKKKSVVVDGYHKCTTIYILFIIKNKRQKI